MQYTISNTEYKFTLYDTLYTIQNTKLTVYSTKFTIHYTRLIMYNTLVAIYIANPIFLASLLSGISLKYYNVLKIL